MESMGELPSATPKNKDPTGTKVKRSLKRISEDDVANHEGVEQNGPSTNNNGTKKLKAVVICPKCKKCKRKGTTTKKDTQVNLPEKVIKPEDSEESLTIELKKALYDLLGVDTASQREGNVSKTNVIKTEVNDNFTNDKQSDMQNLTNSDEFDIPTIEVKATIPIQTLRNAIEDKLTTPQMKEINLETQMSVDGGETKKDVEELTIINTGDPKELPIIKVEEDSNTLEYAHTIEDEENLEKQMSVHGGEVTNDVKELSAINTEEDPKVLPVIQVQKDSNTIEYDQTLHSEKVEDIPIDNNVENKEAVKTKESGEVLNVLETESQDSDDLEKKVLELERKMLNQFKGSLFDTML